jgi:hypothetical protein
LTLIDLHFENVSSKYMKKIRFFEKCSTLRQSFRSRIRMQDPDPVVNKSKSVEKIRKIVKFLKSYSVNTGQHFFSLGDLD